MAKTTVVERSASTYDREIGQGDGFLRMNETETELRLEMRFIEARKRFSSVDRFEHRRE